jgi:hypothetical protein
MPAESEMRTVVADELSLSATSDLTKIRRELNRGIVDVLRRTGCYVTTTTITLTAGTTDYDLASSASTVMEIQRVYQTGQTRLMTRVSEDELLSLKLSGVANGDVVYYAVAGNNLLRLHPAPSGGTLTVDYTPTPTAMSASTDNPASASLGGIPEKWHPAVETYAMWKLASEDDDQSSGQGERYRTQYEGENRRGGWIGEILGEMKRKGGRRRPPFRGPGGHLGRPWMPSPYNDVER